MTRFLVVGGAGFIGSHIVTHLLANDVADQVVVYDNLTSGSRELLAHVEQADRIELVEADVQDVERLTTAADGVDVAVHLAANPDIAAAVTKPDIDFWQGTLLTQNVLEALRRAGVPRLLYASGSGVYGDVGDVATAEDHAPMHPISTYGASKLGCEALISSYCHMFGLAATAFRFANVVGARQTHGVTYDFVRKLLLDPRELEILGDGSQSKSYIHVDDVIGALMLMLERQKEGFEVYNVGTDDYATVREIADMVVMELGLTSVAYRFTGGDRGWKGDVPIVRLDTTALRARGWSNRYGSIDALRASIRANEIEARGSG